MPESHETARRIKAARMLAGIPSANALAERLDTQGLGGVTIRKIEAGTRDVRPHELRAIAAACGLPYEFFTIDFATLAGAAQAADREDGQELTRTVEQVVDRLRPQLEDAVTKRVLRRLGTDPHDA